MRKIFFIISFFIFLSFCYANEYEIPFEMYKDNYFVAGNSDDQVKFQLSIMSPLIYPFDIGFYFGYTQTTWWEIYNGADTMSANYMPEFFYRKSFENSFFDYVQISPFQHCSTGIEGEKHRSINIAYAQTQFSYGKKFNIGDNIKLWFYESRCKRNKDIAKYKGYYENDIFIKWMSTSVSDMSLAELHFKHGGTFKNIWIAPEFRIRVIGTDIQPKIFVQFYYGKGGTNIVNYNKTEKELRAGFIF